MKNGDKLKNIDAVNNKIKCYHKKPNKYEGLVNDCKKIN